MPIETIRAAYAKLQNHRAVAERFRLPLHVVMFALGLMPEPLYNTVNATPYLTATQFRLPRRRIA